ncbi:MULTISPECIES: CbtA family protein [Halocynthiibacter]|uniref:CbtA family protein n=1 Tax=Halocynthiibacter halioticoli TaxID=2986804 RepID=A0AAE3LQ72_9RHOB|nr:MULTISPECIES: CbtA family protein [Halocynthiibacter]MCV6823229.1 CbtA family protein [Halocynthiibacter halioticoli]MCW4056230.1 CbtA family protein [Halocynthiibacter sp. SDUM655004]
MFKQIFSSALYAGLIAGLISALLQFWLVTPLLLEGEEYETGAKSHYAGVLIVDGEDVTASEEEEEVEAPPTTSEKLARHGMTVAMNVLVFTGFGLIVAAAFGTAQMAGLEVNARTGLIWGLVGFVVIQLAPAAGLYPELPGTPADDVTLRQMWWITTVIATAVGIGMITFGANLWWGIAGAAFIALPHVIGAPHLDFYAGVAPPELAALFVSRTLAVACATWVVLGGVAGYAWHKHAV